MRSFLKEQIPIYSTQNVIRNIDKFNRYKSNLRNYIKQLKDCEFNDITKILKPILLDENELELFYAINELFFQLKKQKKVYITKVNMLFTKIVKLNKIHEKGTTDE